MPVSNLAVLITSFNRRELTLRSLASLFNQRDVENLRLSVFLVDDGSTDSTAAAVNSMFPAVQILQGDGTLFWNGGMRKAFAVAMEEAFDAYLLLNDDTILYEDALARAIECANSYIASGPTAIVVGSTRSQITGNHSYGGIARRLSGLEMKLEKIPPDPVSPKQCDTMNGNFALVPQQVVDAIGNLESRFRHQFGDLDYGLRARGAGFAIVIAPGYVGECHLNSSAGSWSDPKAPFAKRWANLISPKGVPFPEWFLFTRRHYSWRWPYYSISPYLKTIVSSLLRRNNFEIQSSTAAPKA